jgi:hypothetical protein
MGFALSGGWAKFRFNSTIDPAASGGDCAPDEQAEASKATIARQRPKIGRQQLKADDPEAEFYSIRSHVPKI